jgi:hypothetical protein
MIKLKANFNLYILLKLYSIVNISYLPSYNQRTSQIRNGRFECFNNETMLHDRNEFYRSKFVATCYCSRKCGFYLINFFSFNFLIIVLSLTLFAIDLKNADRRITSNFTLILTLSSFKVVTSNSLPAISYLTSLDKYQIFNIIFLVTCCIWHSICAALSLENKKKLNLDYLMLIFFSICFFLFQLVFAVLFMKSFKKIQRLKNKDLIYKKIIANYSNSIDYDE